MHRTENLIQIELTSDKIYYCYSHKICHYLFLITSIHRKVLTRVFFCDHFLCLNVQRTQRNTIYDFNKITTFQISNVKKKVISSYFAWHNWMNDSCQKKMVSLCLRQNFPNDGKYWHLGSENSMFWRIKMAEWSEAMFKLSHGEEKTAHSRK